MRIYVTRDSSGDYSLFKGPKKKIEKIECLGGEHIWGGKNHVASICSETFDLLAAFRLRLGQGPVEIKLPMMNRIIKR